MANWWEDAPLADDQPAIAKWWEAAPLAEEAPKAKAPEGWLDYANSAARAAASGVTFGFADELAGLVGAGGNRVLRAMGMDVPEKSYTDIREKEDQGIRDFRETNPVAAYTSEIGGAVAMPLGAGANMLRGGLTAGKVLKGAATVGAPTGAVSRLGEAKSLDDAGDVVGEAVTGGLMGAGGYAIGAPLAYGVGKGIQAIGKAFRYAGKPKDAALEKTAQALIDDDIEPSALRGLVAPKGKEAAGNRGLSDVQVSEVIRRVRDGEDLSAIAGGMVNPKTGKPFTPATLSRYVSEYADNTDVPMNLIDLAKSMPESGGAAALTNLGRAAASSRGKAQSTAAKALINRQKEQGGRMGEHLDRAAGGVNIEDEIARLEGVVGAQSKTAYDAARANTKPFDLRGVISKWRADAKGNDAVSRQLNEALDSFFDPGLVEQVSAKTGKTMDQLRHTKLMQPTSDMEQFMRSRRGLDDMIDTAKAKTNGKPNTLSRVLSGLRRDLNDAARKDNPDWLKADTLFSEGKAGQAAIEMGEKLALRSGGKQREILAKFDKMPDEQKSLVRLGLVRQLQDRVLNKGEGHDVTAQLSNEGMNRMILRVFPPKVGQRLIRDVQREGITTDTLREVFGGSRTAPMMEDMKQLGQDAALVGNLLSGNVGGSLREAASRIMRGLNEKQSQEITTLLTNTRPEDLLPLIDALGKAKERLQKGEPLRNILKFGGGIVGAQSLPEAIPSNPRRIGP